MAIKKYGSETLEFNKNGEISFYRDIKKKYSNNKKVYHNIKNESTSFLINEMIVIEKDHKVYMIPYELDGIKLTDDYLLCKYSEEPLAAKTSLEIKTEELKERLNRLQVHKNDNEFDGGEYAAGLFTGLRDTINMFHKISTVSKSITDTPEYENLVNILSGLTKNKKRTKGGLYVRK